MRLLSELSKRAAVQPLWTLLVANEYLDRHDPLRLALVAMTARAETQAASAELLAQARSGATFRELPASQQEYYRLVEKNAEAGRARRAANAEQLGAHLQAHRTLRLAAQATRAAHPVMQITSQRARSRRTVGNNTVRQQFAARS